MNLQMLSNMTIDGVTTHVKACTICGGDLKAEVCGEVNGKPLYVNNIHLDEAYQREESDRRVREGRDP